MEMFDFRIINTLDGNQIIDRTLKTPEDSLTAVQMVEYMETESVLSHMDHMKKKQRRKQNGNGGLQGIRYIGLLVCAV